MKNNPFLFDIESGGLSGDQSSILSISYSSGEESKTLIASPEVGSRISRWSEKKVWEPLKNLPGIRSEKDILKDFLGVLKQQTSVAGWNIGYTPTTQSESTSGFDIPMLITRAKKYGLQEEYQKEFSRVNIRDIGKEWSVKIASEVSKYPDLVDPQLYEQAAAFNRVATTKEALEGKSGTLLAEAMAPYRLAGWKQETVASLLDISYQSHQSSEDISALRKIMESSSSFSGPESVSAWNRLALKNRLVSAALSGAAIEKRTGFFSSLEERAKKFNILPEFQSSLQGEAKIRGASLGALQRGEGFREVLSEVKAPLLSRKSTRLAIGLGIGATALLLKPLSLFSGKDDAFNTIEGLAHGGEAEKSRRKHSDFGSGYVGLWHVTPEKNLEDIKRSGLRVDKSKNATTSGNAIYGTLPGWINRASFNSLAGLGIPEGRILEYQVDPETTFAEWDESPSFFAKKRHEKLSDILSGKIIPNPIAGILQTVTYKNIQPDKIKEIGNFNYSDRNEFQYSSLFNLARTVSSGAVLYAGLTAKDVSFNERMHQIFGESSRFVKHIPTALWAGNSIWKFSQNPTLSEAAKFGLGAAGWEVGMRLGTRLTKKLPIKHLGLPGVIGHLAANFLSKFAYNIIPGKDDEYNTIEGLPHGGEAQKKRKELTDFGSGYKGLVNLFRGTKEKITEHLGLLGQANLSKEHRLVEDILERVRKVEYPSRPSRLTSSFWSISPKEAERYAGTSGYLSVIKGGEETFFTRQSYYSDLFKELYSPSRTKDTLVEKARTYWKGIDPSNKMEDIEALIPGVATAKKVYQIETTINKKRWNALHLKSMKQHSEYSAKPGRKHTGQAGKILG